jgi:hypothetical protein
MVRHGKGKYFNTKTGDLEIDGQWKDGMLDGKSIKHYIDGRLMAMSDYKSDIPDGYYQRYFPNGQLGFKGSSTQGDLCPREISKLYSVSEGFEARYRIDFSFVFLKNGQIGKLVQSNSHK